MLSLTMLDSVIKANKKYYSQIFLEEGKYERKGEYYYIIIDDLNLGSSDSESDESDNKSYNESDN